MAAREVVILIDDLTHQELAPERGETITFGVGSTTYEIDLSHENAEQFRAALAPYIRAGRRVRNKRPHLRSVSA